MSENIIDVRNISKSFAGRKVVDDLSLSVAQGEVFEKVGVQLQSSAYQAAIKVGEICEEFAPLYNEPADYRNLLEQFGLLPLIKSPVMKLSGGERQKLSVVHGRGGNVVKRFLTLYKIEQKLFFCSPDVFIFNLCMPVVTLLLIGFIAGNKTVTGSDITFIQSAFASLTAIGICCSAFMSIPIVMVDYRDKKILKHLYCSPASPARMGQDMGASLVNIIILAVITVVCSTVAVKTFRWE